VDLRHADAGSLAGMLDGALAAATEAGAERGCEVTAERVWAIAPTRFDEELVADALAACRDVTGEQREITSGALHDAAEVARVLPAAMMFCPSRGGVSHAPQEDTSESDLARAVEAFGSLAARVLAR
jgi:acetylornithine deacetylase/succinyl-diaminopimelate desuccinylase-like protein